MTDSVLKVRVDAPSGTVILNRPQHHNALSRSMVHELLQVFEDLYRQLSVRAVIITGAGNSFCAGTDLKELHQSTSDPLTSPQSNLQSQQQWQDDVMASRELLASMWRFPKPIIAAIHGPALGMGAGLALVADLVIASPSATFGFPEIRRGLVAGLSAPLLHFRLAGARSAQLLMTGEPIDADTALQWGLFQEIVAHDLLWARAQELAQQCATAPHESVALTKRMLNENIGELLTTQLSLGAALTATARTTEMAAEGIAAFVEKRPPKWQT
ncbi:MAG: enoyl-CoA hydratase/isomerase family protein [Pirellulaceae bacterium]